MRLSLHRHQVTNLANKINGLNSFLKVVRVGDFGSEDFQVLFLLLDLVDDFGVGDGGVGKAGFEMVFYDELRAGLRVGWLDCFGWGSLDGLALSGNPSCIPRAPKLVHLRQFLISRQVQFFPHFPNLSHILTPARMFFQLQHTLHPRLVLCYQLRLIQFRVLCLYLHLVLLHLQVLCTLLVLQMSIARNTVFCILENWKCVLLWIHLPLRFFRLLLHKLTIRINGRVFFNHSDFLYHFQIGVEWRIGLFRHVLKTVFKDVGKVILILLVHVKTLKVRLFLFLNLFIGLFL